MPYQAADLFPAVVGIDAFELAVKLYPAGSQKAYLIDYFFFMFHVVCVKMGRMVSVLILSSTKVIRNNCAYVISTKKYSVSSL